MNVQAINKNNGILNQIGSNHKIKDDFGSKTQNSWWVTFSGFPDFLLSVI